MSDIATQILALQKSDEQFLNEVIAECKMRSDDFVKSIKEVNAQVLQKWKKNFRDKVESTVSATETLMGLMGKRREIVNQKALEDFAKKLRAKNVETLGRLAKGKKRDKLQLTKLAESFEETAVDQIEEEKIRLESGSTGNLARGFAEMANHGIFDTAEKRFIESYANQERDLLAKITASSNETNKRFFSDIISSDFKFRSSLPEHVVGPQGTVTMLVNMRDKKREMEIMAWRIQRDIEFGKIRHHIDTQNAILLKNLDQEFESLIKG